MTTYIIYSDPNDGEIQSYAPTYAAARAKTGTVNVSTTGTYARTGQNVDAAGNKYVYESFWSFDTSVIAPNDRILDVTATFYTGWTNNNQEMQWGQGFHLNNWAAPLTAASWVDPNTLTDANVAFGFDYLNPNTPFSWKYSGRDALITSINRSGPTKFVSVSNKTRQSLAPTGTQEIWAQTADTTNKPSLTVYTTAPSVLNTVGNASVSLADGTVVSLRSDGSASPTVSAGYIPMAPGAVWTAISTIDPSFSTSIHSRNSIALTCDPAGNFFVVGVQTGTTGSLVGQAFARTGTTNVWTPKTALSQNLPAGNSMTVRALAAAYQVGGSDSTDKPTIYVIAARGGSQVRSDTQYHVGGAGWSQEGVLNPVNLLAGSGALLLGATNQFSPSIPVGVPVMVDLVSMGNNLNAVYIQRGQFGPTTVGGVSTIRIYNGGGTIIGLNNTYEPTGASQLIAISPTVFCHVFDAAGNSLKVRFYNNTCQILGEASIPQSSFFGGVIGSQFDGYYDRQAGLVRVYYVDSSAATAISRIDVSPVTFNVVTTASELTGISAAGTTNPVLRVPSGAAVDERRISLDSNTVGASAQLVSNTTSFSVAGNMAPNAPALTVHPNFDATQATTFLWTASDANKADSQTAFDIEFSKVSDSSIALAPAKITSSLSSYTLAASALSNGINYRWRTRTYDVLNTTGAWSGYSNFTTAATGNTVITSPATDNMTTGNDVSSYNITWTYTGSGVTQSQRQVKVVRTSDNFVVSDTGMQVNTTPNYTISGLESGKQYRVDVTLINSSSITVPTISRFITPNYSQPMTPTMTISAMASYNLIQIVNPTPSGIRPQVLYNDIYRRNTNDQNSSWVRIATVGNGAAYSDYAVKSSFSYDYQIIGRSS